MLEKYYKSIFYSILLHTIIVALVIGASYLSPVTSFLKPNSEKIEIEIKDTRNLIPKQQNFDKLKQIVRSHQVPDDLIVPPKDLNKNEPSFLSDQTRRVKEQMKSAYIGKTSNSTSARQADNNNNNKQPSPEKTKDNHQKNSNNDNKNVAKDTRPAQTVDISKNKTEDADVLVNNKKNELILPPLNIPKTSEFKFQNNSDSGTRAGEMLPQSVKVGTFTALNTDRYMFYSFYERIDNQIRYPWETMVWKVFDRTPKNVWEKKLRPYRTDVEIWLKPNGQFHSAHVMKESGVLGFDEAATQVFEQSKIFPNPPKEMVEDDGFIHLRYSFFVHTDIAKEMADR